MRKFRVKDKETNQWMDYDDVFMDVDGEIWLIEERSFAYQTYMHKENITEKVEVHFYDGVF